MLMNQIKRNQFTLNVSLFLNLEILYNSHNPDNYAGFLIS